MQNDSTNIPPMTETIDSAHAAASTLFLGHNGEWWDSSLILAVIFAALAAIAIGVTTAGSIISHTREAASAERALEAYKLAVDDRVADAKKEGIAAGKSAGDALLKAAELEKQAEQLRKDTAEANARAAEAKLELEKFRAPRTLSIEQQRRVSEKLRPFAPRQFDVAMPPGDSEAAQLMIILVTVLRDAGWTQVPWKYPDGFQGLMFTTSGFESAGNATIQGLSIVGQVSEVRAITAVVDALNAEGVPTDAHGVEGIKNDNPTVMHIMIGRK
ncbi:hypothetical protein [Afipia sp. GAS231]|uniref:hypothetical protein n=1 Tax=Afipia sp. GAS231 TaxID=1882747 RepID=UPI00087CB484|nr:hypothetical protein [Afipia sp. GAS231]SDO01880.1 hypothetical protein SAMN05444050_3014 [Afipia sp. GAS231]